MLGIRGRSGAGKTTLIEALLPKLNARGIRTGTIKHAHKGATLDVSGKDSHRHAAAGAACVLLLAPGQAGFFVPRAAEPAPEDWLELFAGRADLVLVEGFSKLPMRSITVEGLVGEAVEFEATAEGWRLGSKTGGLPPDGEIPIVPAPLLDRIADAVAEFLAADRG